MYIKSFRLFIKLIVYLVVFIGLAIFRFYWKIRIDESVFDGTLAINHAVLALFMILAGVLLEFERILYILKNKELVVFDVLRFAIIVLPLILCSFSIAIMASSIPSVKIYAKFMIDTRLFYMTEIVGVVSGILFVRCFEIEITDSNKV